MQDLATSRTLAKYMKSWPLLDFTLMISNVLLGSCYWVIADGLTRQRRFTIDSGNLTATAQNERCGNF